MGAALRVTEGGWKGRNLSVVLGGRGEEVDSFDRNNEGQRETAKGSAAPAERRRGKWGIYGGKQP